MDNTEKTPLWLDLRKEYIDDNFDKLQNYLQKCSMNNDKDSFYEITLNLLRERIEDLVNSLASRPIYKEDDAVEDPTFNIRLLALYLLVDSDPQLLPSAYVAFMGELKTLQPKFSDNFLDNAMKALSHERISSLGFTWQDLDNIKTELFAYKASQANFEQPLQKPRFYQRYGTAIATSDGLYLTHENQEDAKKLIRSGASSIDTGVGVMLRTTASQKLKQSLDNSIPEMMEYTTDFMYSMRMVKSKTNAVRLKTYHEEDEATIKITAIDYDGTIHVETVDPQYEKLSGIIRYKMQSLVYYYTNTLYRDFLVGDCFKATVTSLSNRTFCIDSQFVDFIVEDNKRLEKEETDDFLAMLIDIRPNYYGWLNEFGIAMFTKNTGEYEKGSYAILTVDRYGIGKEHGKIYANIEYPSEDRFDEQAMRKDCIRAFATKTKEPQPLIEKNETSKLNPAVISLLLRQLFVHQKSLLKPSERYRFLANAYIMAELLGDDLSASYIKFAATYLRVLVQFVSNEDIKSLNLEPEKEYAQSRSTLIRLSVVQLLKEYGRKDNSEVLSNAIETFQDSLPLLARLARLIQTANSMQGTLSDASVNVIRREIIKTLSIETENDADLEADSGSYLGVESGTQEFKTSMVFPPNNNMQPDEYAQNINVLKGVCAFLNSTTGGVLYLGVNDQGYVTGIDNDMNYLRIHSIDSYMRYVQDNAKKHFGIDALPYLRMEPLYDNKVVAIHVEPHPYRVVELLDTAYLRVNAESRKMPEKVRQDLISRKMLTNRDNAAAISHLQHACTQKKCVVLHNYASSHSGSVSDRFVEAYDVLVEDGLVVCYDRNSTTARKVKVFNINRIGYVEILDNEPWQYTDSHAVVKVDAFHMAGDTAMHVSLQMDLFCKNQLVEQYPATKNDIKPHKGDDNIWYYDATVYHVEPIARFYLGLANRIKILDAPELVSYVKQFVKEHLS